MSRNFLSDTWIWSVLGAVVFILLTAVLVGTFSKTLYTREVLALFDMDFLNKASEYQRVSLVYFLIRNAVVLTFYTGVALLAWRTFSVAGAPSLLKAALYVALLFMAFYLLTFPLDYYRGFLVEHRFGLSNHTFVSWLNDYALNRGISLFISVLTFTGLYALAIYFPVRWWVFAGILFSLFMFLSAYLYPLVIDPLFYRFEPLQDEGMRSQIVHMAEKAGIRVEEVLVADASRKTGKANAYFTGLGSSKRIVIFDNLLERFTGPEALAVIAHEMGHWKHNHIIKGLLLGSAAVFSTLFLFQLALKGLGLWTADIRIIPLALLFFALISFAGRPVENAISRAFERQADREAVHLTRDPASLVSLKQNLARNNLSSVWPHPYIKMILYSHPPIMERIDLILEEGEKLQ